MKNFVMSYSCGKDKITQYMVFLYIDETGRVCYNRPTAHKSHGNMWS